MGSVRPNRRRQKCAQCAKWVEANAGYLSQSESVATMGQWIVHHPKCAPDHIARAGNLFDRKCLTAEGRIYHPYDDTVIPKLRALPGAYWDGNHKYWCVSLEPQDRERLIEGAEQLNLEIAAELRESAASGLAEQAAGRAKNLPAAVASCARWLAARKQAILNTASVESRIEAVVCAINASRPTILLTSEREFNSWKKAFDTLRLMDLTIVVVKRQKDWEWPTDGQVVVTTLGRLPKALAPVVVGTDETGHEIKAVNFLPSSRRLAQRSTLIVDDVDLLTNFGSQQSQRVFGLAGHTSAIWLLGNPPNQPSKLWDALRVGHMDRIVFDKWPTFKRCFNGNVGRWNRIVWGQAEPEAAERLYRVCYEKPSL